MINIFLICVGFLYPINVFAKITTIEKDEDYVIPSEYAFTPKFINGVTKLETSETYNKAYLYNNTTYRCVYRSHDYHNYWAIYRNVGIWKQHVVDMKIIVDDVMDTDSTKKCTKFGNIIPDEDVIGLEFRTNSVGINVSAECREEGTMGLFKVEFYDGITGEELTDIKTTLTYTDIDYLERLLLDNDNIENAFYYTPFGVEHLDLVDANYKNRYTFFKGNMKWTCTYDGWPGDVQCINTPNSVRDCYNNDCTGCYKAGMVVTLNEGSFVVGWAGQGLVFSSPSFFRVADPNAIKTVDKEIVKPGEEINYKIEQYVPNQSSIQYYKLWKITDRLESILETSIDNITITSNEGENINDKFNIELQDNVVTVSAKEDYLGKDEFYNKTFYINIKAKVAEDIKDVKEINNKAILDAQYGNNIYSGDIPSNPVKTVLEVEEPKKEEVVEVPNTGKFASTMMIVFGILFVCSGVFIILKMTKKKTAS